MALTEARTKQAVVALAAVNATIMLLRFTEQCLLTRALGAGRRLDAYFLGQVVLLLGGQVAVAVTSAAVPLLAETAGHNLDVAARRMLLACTVFVVVSFSAIAALHVPIIGLLGGKLDPESMLLASTVFLWMQPAAAASILAGMLRAYWHAKRNFLVPGVGQLFVPVCTCGGAVFVALGLWDLRLAAASANIGALLLAGVLHRPLWGNLHAWSAEAAGSDLLKKVASRFGAALLPVSIGFALLPAMIAAARFFASSLPAGSVTAISLAAGLGSIPGQFAAASVGMVLLPQISLLKAAGRSRDAARVVERALCNMAFIATPCTVFLVLWSREVVEAVFKHGAFDKAAVELTASALTAYSFGIPAQAAMQVLVFALFAMLWTRHVACMAAITLVVNLLLSRFLLPFGVSGVASAFSLACLLDGAVLLCLLVKALPEMRVRALLFRHLSILVISVLAGGMGSVIARYLQSGRALLSLLVPLTLVAAIYLGVNLLVASPEMGEILAALRWRAGRRLGVEALSPVK